MTSSVNSPSHTRGLTRRNALLLPLLAPALAGCGAFDWLTDEQKKPIPGNREPVLATNRGLAIDNVEPVILPPVTDNPNWLQYAGATDHVGANYAGGLTKLWTVNVGRGGNYRARFTAQPLIAGGRVFTMDTDGVVAAFDLATGHPVWRSVTKPKKLHNSNIGGGIAIDGDHLYAVTGRGQLLALNLSNGTQAWHADLHSPARSAPLVSNGEITVVTVDQQLQAFSQADGKYL